MGVPQNGWFIIEHPIEYGWFGGSSIVGHLPSVKKYKALEKTKNMWSHILDFLLWGGLWSEQEWRFVVFYWPFSDDIQLDTKRQRRGCWLNRRPPCLLLQHIVSFSNKRSCRFDWLNLDKLWLDSIIWNMMFFITHPWGWLQVLHHLDGLSHYLYHIIYI